ncbi:MAG: hypothetical protein ACP5XB_09400, partial [Isosphaeraceae bacterium]
MAQTVYCPKCQAKGSVPDGVPRARIHCPRCDHQFEYRSPASAGSQSRATPPSSSTVEPPRRTPDTSYDDVETAQPLAAAGSPGVRRAPRVRELQGQTAKSSNPLLYALVGISGVATFLLGVVVVLLLRGSGNQQAPVAPPRAVAEVSETSIPAEPAPLERVADIHPAPASPVLPLANDPQEVIRRLKDATVYLKNKVNGRTVSSGSGFVIEVRGDVVTLAT